MTELFFSAFIILYFFTIVSLAAEAVSSTTENSDAGTVSPSSSSFEVFSEFLEIHELRHTTIAQQRKIAQGNILQFFILLIIAIKIFIRKKRGNDSTSCPRHLFFTVR